MSAKSHRGHSLSSMLFYHSLSSNMSVGTVTYEDNTDKRVQKWGCLIADDIMMFCDAAC